MWELGNDIFQGKALEADGKCLEIFVGKLRMISTSHTP